MFHDHSIPAANPDRALLLALLRDSDIERAPIDDHGRLGFRLSLLIPREALAYLELLGAAEEDAEESDHSGIGDEDGLALEIGHGETDLASGEDENQDHAWTPPRFAKVAHDLEENESIAA